MIECIKAEVAMIMKNNILHLTALVLSLSLIFSGASFCVSNGMDFGSSIDSDEISPVSVIITESGEGYQVGDNLLPVRRDGKNYLFLPSTADAKALKLKYTGDYELYAEGNDIAVSSGETFTADVSSGTLTVYELSSNGKLYKHSLTVMQSAKVSTVYINLEGGDDALELIHANKENYTTGTMRMTAPDGSVVYDGVLDKFKGHGNTSFVAPGVVGDKKSYNIKLAKKAELVDGAGKAKKWTLLHIRVSTAYYYDYTGLTTNMAFSTFTSLAGDEYYGVCSEYSDVYINGIYRGTYILTERMDVNAAIDVTQLDDFVTCDDLFNYTYVNSSGDAQMGGVQKYKYCTLATLADATTDITGGYVLEVSFNSLDPERCGFVTKNGMYVDIKAPEACTEEMVRYIASYVQDFENALYTDTGYNEKGKHYTDYVNLRSLADMILTYSFYQNWELFRTSTYMYIDVAGTDFEKLTFGPAWDFETGYEIIGSDNTFFGKHNVYSDRQQYIWLERLWGKSDFMDVLNSEGLRMIDIISQQLVRGNVGSAYDLYDSVAASQHMNWERWGIAELLSNTSKHQGTKTDFDTFAKAQIQSYITRLDNYRTFFNKSEYNFGVTVSGYKRNSDGALLLIAAPSADITLSYKWYKLNDDGVSGTLISGISANTLSPEKDGKYYCVVTGKNNAYYSGSRSDVFNSADISIASVVYDTANAVLTDELPASCQHYNTEWRITQKPTCEADGVETLFCDDCTLPIDSRPVEKLGHLAGEWTVVVEPTESHSGLREKYCVRCGKVLDTEKLDMIYVNKFTDVKDTDWYANSVKYAVVHGLLLGDSPTTFSPEMTMTRAMLVTALSRLEDTSAYKGASSHFRDVKQGEWYTVGVVWAEKNFIVSGTSFDTFSPNDPVTREQTAQILYKYAIYKGLDTTGKNDITTFDDYSSISNYAIEALKWANNSGIIRGMTPTTLAPLSNSNRAQVATMLKGFCEKYPEMLENLD